MVYENATSVIKINGHISTPIPIQCGVRNGFPLNMIIFVLCLNTLLNYPGERVLGLQAHGTQRKTTAIAYADDVSILMTAVGRENSPSPHNMLREGN